MAQSVEVAIPWRQNVPNLAASFAETRTPLEDDDASIIFLPQLNSFVDPALAQDVQNGNNIIWAEAQTECAKLFDAMDTFQDKLPTHLQQKEQKIDIRKSSWRQVLGEVTAVSNQYRDLTNFDAGPAPKLRRCLRTLGKKGTTFEHWLNLLPDGDYGASISGAFRLIVKASKNLENVREVICEALSDIPDAMEGASNYVKIYGPQFNSRLLQITAELYTAIAIALRMIMEYFTKNWWSRFGKALVRGDSYERGVQKTIANVKNLVQTLNGTANRSMQNRLYQMDSRQMMMNDMQIKMQMEIREQQAMIKALTQKADENEEKAVSSRNVLLQMMYRLLASNPNYDFKTNNYIEGPGFTAELECGDAPTPEFQAAILSSSTSPTPHPAVSLGPSLGQRKDINPDELLDILEFDPQTPLKDIGRCFSSVYNMEVSEIDTAHWIIRSLKFQTWLSEAARSSELLVQGNRDPFKPISPLSFFCGHLWNMLSDPAIVITHVCGLKRDFDDDRHNAKGMLVSLIGQLLSQPKDKGLEFDLSWIEEKHRQLLQNNDLDFICQIFRELVKQIPKKRILFCVIDGISWYETGERKDDTLAVLETLRRSIHEGTDALCKLVLTCPNRSLFIHEYIDSADILYVIDNVDGTGHGTWDASAGQEDFHYSIVS